MTSSARRPFGAEDITINVNTVERPRFLEACLDSLLRTTPAGVSLQILFNSTPKVIRERTIDQASAWEGPTSFIHLDDLLPVDESHNVALAGIETELVNFMGDDDIVLGNRIPRILEAFNSITPPPVVITTFARRIAGDPFEPAIGSNKDLGATTIDEWVRWHESGRPFELLWPGAVLRTEELRSIGGFEPEFSKAFDTRIFSKMSFRGPVLAVPDRNFGFRIHQGSLSTGSWGQQHLLHRYIGACSAALLDERPEPSLEEHMAREAADPRHIRIRRSLRERSRIHFRTGGELALSGRRLDGLRYLIVAFLIWPPAFFEKVSDQLGGSPHRWSKRLRSVWSRNR